MLGISDLFFKRQKRLRGEYPDVYQYDDLPQALKVQIIHVWEESIGRDYVSNGFTSTSDNYKYLEKGYKILCKELGVFKLNEDDEYHNGYFERISNYFLRQEDSEISLSVIEVMIMLISIYSENKHKRDIPSKVIKEINERFSEHGVGYQIENSKIVRVDSGLIHSEAVKPVLSVLRSKLYKGAEQEFLRAHEHYRHQRYQEAMVDCLKAYESTIKIIMKKRGWNYNENDTADALTGKIIQSGLIPTYWSQYFKSLKNTLTAGVPTARNKEAGHGQANDLKDVPDYLVAYILHMTASAILFLAKAEESL